MNFETHNRNHQIFVVGDPYCTFPTLLRDTTPLDNWGMHWMREFKSFGVGGRSCFWVLTQGLLMPGGPRAYVI